MKCTASTPDSAQGASRLEAGIPPLIARAIRLVVRDELAFSAACLLFVEDTSDSRPEDRVSIARLERAIARATLHAWTHGQGSTESVGSAYAVVGDRVARADKGTR